VVQCAFVGPEVLMYYTMFFSVLDFLDISGQSVSEWLSCLSNILFVASFTLHEVDDKF